MPKYSIKLLLLVTLLFAVVLATLFTPRGRINQFSVDQLQDGMFTDQCSQIIGLPPGDYDA